MSEAGPKPQLLGEIDLPRFIRLVRTAKTMPLHGIEWLASIWSMDTPPGRAALERLAALGNSHYGRNTHWIEEEGHAFIPGASLSHLDL